MDFGIFFFERLDFLLLSWAYLAFIAVAQIRFCEMFFFHTESQQKKKSAIFLFSVASRSSEHLQH